MAGHLAALCVGRLRGREPGRNRGNLALHPGAPARHQRDRGHQRHQRHQRDQRNARGQRDEGRLMASDEERSDSRQSPPTPWGIAFDLGVRLGVSVILGLGAGLVLDNWLKTSPLLTLIGLVVGVAAAMYTIWDVARDAMRR